MTTPAGAGVFVNNPHIDELLVFDKRGKDRGIGAFFGLANGLLERNFDIAILPHRSFRTGLLTFMARIPERIGFKKAPGALFYTDSTRRPMGLHEAERMLALLTGLNPDIEPAPTELFPGEVRRDKARLFFEEAGIESSGMTIAIAPGSVWGTKRYPPQYYAKAVDALLKGGYADSAIIIGGTNDSDLAGEIIERVDGRIFSAAGYGDILTSAAIIEKCDLLIGNDSSPGHIAAAMKTPVLSIFGPTTTGLGFVPYGEKVRVIEPHIQLDCRPCSPHGKMTCPRGDHVCMTSIQPERVVEVAVEMLELG